MGERSSRFTGETRDKEAWLVHLLEGEPGGREELGSLLRTAAVLRRAVSAIDVPQGAEEASRERAVGQPAENLRRGPQLPEALPRAPWFTRIGSAMRFVFTLGRRR
jgi:hypothetical protein